MAKDQTNDFTDGKIKIATVIVERDENNFSPKDREELDMALRDVAQGKNLEGPFHSAEEFIKNN
jgi:hypothetical protein